jgi:acyl-CoA dehydrogenase
MTVTTRSDAATSAVDGVLDTVREHAARTDEQACFPAEAMAALRASGLLGLVVPAEYGGGGGGIRDVVAVSERLAREDLSVALIFAMHCQQAEALVRFAEGELRSSLLPRVARGEVYLASVTTERGKGGHLLTAGSALQWRDGMLWLERDAPIVTGAGDADGFLITMRAPDADSPTQVSLVYADRGQLEVTMAGTWQPLGMRASHSLPLKLAGAIPAHQVVGRHGGFREIVTAVFGPMAHLGWAACWLGTASGALARTLAMLRTPQGRSQYDLSSDLFLTRLARIRSRLVVVRALLDQSVSTVERPDLDPSTPPVQLLLNTLKTTAADECFAAVDGLMVLTGLRQAYLRDSPLWLERAFRDLRSAALNYSNDRLNLASGSLALMDAGVHLG